MVQTTTPIPIDKTLHPFQRCEQAVTHIAVLKAKPNGVRITQRLADLAGVAFGTMNSARVLMKRGTAKQIDELRRGVTTIGHEYKTVSEPREATTMTKKHKHKPKQKHEKFRASMMTTPVTTSVAVPVAEGVETERVEVDRRGVIPLIDKMADGRRWTDAEITQFTGLGRARRFIYENGLPLIPWLTIDRTTDGTIFIIDKELRAICEWHTSRVKTPPNTPTISVRDFLRELRTEITRRRKENHDKRGASRWDPAEVNLAEQRALLDYIEAQLDKVSLDKVSGI
jgi:hypothetical protein